MLKQMACTITTELYKGSFTAAVQKQRVVTNLQLEKALLQCTWVNSISIRQDMTPNIVASANFVRFDISSTPEEEGSRFPLRMKIHVF